MAMPAWPRLLAPHTAQGAQRANLFTMLPIMLSCHDECNPTTTAQPWQQGARLQRNCGAPTWHVIRKCRWQRPTRCTARIPMWRLWPFRHADMWDATRHPINQRAARTTSISSSALNIASMRCAYLPDAHRAMFLGPGTRWRELQ